MAAWGKKYENRRAPYAADYNRAYDTHTSGEGANNAFANNDVSMADRGPANYSGIQESRAYRNPTKVVQEVRQDDAGYLGDSRWTKELQTGNAASGGYTTLPGLGFTANQPNVVGVNPDRRRLGGYKPMDWEHDQEDNMERRDRDIKKRRYQSHTVEDYATPKAVTRPPIGWINRIEDSPYRKDWPEPDRLTTRINPNPFMGLRDWDAASDKRNSGARYLNGTHYSMAVHNSLTPYVNQHEGGQAVRSWRNTYRLDPQPWDMTNTDSPENTPDYNQQTDLGGGAYGSAWRLS